MGTAGEARIDMERVLRTLRETKTLMAGHDQIESAYQRLTETRHSPLRTAVELALEAAERVLEFLGAQSDGNDPSYQPPGRDGGPI